MSRYNREMRLEHNVYRAVEVLERERYYEFTADLLDLLEFCKHNQRLLVSLLDQHSGVPSARCRERLEKANAQNTWY